MAQIGKYLVRKVLISTGFSTIYQAFDPDLEMQVALKVFWLKGKNAGPKAKYGEASGSISLSAGSTLTFDNVEKIEW